METDKILKAIGALESKVDSLSKQVTAHDSKLRWITSVALLVIGVVGGPNALQLVTGGTGA